MKPTKKETEKKMKKATKKTPVKSFEIGKQYLIRTVEVVPGRQLPWFASERREKRGLK